MKLWQKLIEYETGVKYPIKEADEAPVGWTVNTHVPHERLTVSKMKPAPWNPKMEIPSHFTTDSGGEIEGESNVFSLTHPTGGKINVPAYIAHHIQQLHGRGTQEADQAGSESAHSVLGSLQSVATKLPSSFEFGPDGSTALELDMGHHTGTEGVMHRSEALSRGVATPEDLAHLDSARDEVFRLNREGTEDERKAFVAQHNAGREGSKVRLDMRAGGIFPHFKTERLPTTKWFIPIGKDKETGEMSVYTVAPGRKMSKLPVDRSFAEPNTADAQKAAQEDWWNTGFIG